MCKHFFRGFYSIMSVSEVIFLFGNGSIITIIGYGWAQKRMVTKKKGTDFAASTSLS